MRGKALMAVALTASLTASTITAAPDPRTKAYRQAVQLYGSGMYERARAIFETMPGDPMAEGYAVLCALKMRSVDYPEKLAAYDAKFPESVLSSDITYEYAMRLFDADRYAEAGAQLSLVPEKTVPRGLLQEYIFKKGYCDFAQGRYPEAMASFGRLDGMSQSTFTAPARYLSGIMHYNGNEFQEAIDWFRKAQPDPRFTELTEFYLVDSEFNLKNYDFVIREGERIYPTVPTERKERLSRIISESYLVKGNTEKAREFYDLSSHADMTRSDYFYAGSVLYAVEDYQGAIENFSKMPERVDSLGQIANYHLGNAYIRTRNKVAAMDAFRDASNTAFDAEITEDALFNYAKLAFDLNKDTGGFARYIKDYGTRTKGVQIYGYMALAALYDRDYAAAVEAYDNIDELEPDMLANYTKANYLRAEQLISNGSYRDAIPFLRATSYYIPRTDRFNQIARYWMGESYFRTGDYQNAQKTFQDLYNGAALSGMTEGSLLAYNVAYSYLNQGDYANAAKWFDTYVSDGAKTYREDAMLRRADCDFFRHDYKVAAESYRKVGEEYSSADDIYPYYREALSYGLAGDSRKKVATLKKVEQASPAAPMYGEALYELGRAYMDTKNSADAMRVFKQLLANTEDPTFKARALIGLGMVSRNGSDYEAALGYYKQVVSEMRGSEYADDALLAIESIYQARRQPEKYLEYLEANKLNSDKSEAEKEAVYFNTAEQVYLAGNYNQAISTIGSYLQRYPEGDNAVLAKFYLAESYRETSDKEKAAQAYSEVVASGASGSFAERAHLGYAQMSYSLERYKDAYDGYVALLSAARLDANKDAARLGMMRSAYRAKDYASAIAASDAVKGFSPSDEIRREADYVAAKSYMATSRRDEALAIFSRLAAAPSTSEGAEAAYMLIQDTEDKGKFESVESMVYDFAAKAGDQSYWLAKAYITLGDSFAERARYDQAKTIFESVRDGYTASSATDDVADNVNMRLERLAILMNR